MDIQTSPKPINKQEGTILLSFTEALLQVIDGKKIHKLEWENQGYFGIMIDSRMYLHKPDDTLNYWIFSEGDIIGEDYIVID